MAAAPVGEVSSTAVELGPGPLPADRVTLFADAEL